jgi:5-(carboxyamino)imidazole ribonucleotide mutase
MISAPKVAVIIGSESDRPIAEKTAQILDKLGIPHEVKVLSAHRSPKKLEKYIEASKAEIFIGIAGLAAHLPGFIASRTIKPVIGVPVNVKLQGLDALMSIVQMPKGVPVACVAIDGGENAAWLAAQMLALKDPELQKKLEEQRHE